MPNFGTIVADFLHMIKKSKIEKFKHARKKGNIGMIIARSSLAMSGGNNGF